MIGKYDFDNVNIEKVLFFFEPAIHTISVLLEEQKVELKRNNILDDSFLKVFNFFKNMEFLDDFNEGKDIISFYYDDFWKQLINMNKEQVVDRHRFWPNIISIQQIAEILDRWIKISYDNLKKGLEVLNIQECTYDLKRIIANHCDNLKRVENGLFFNKQINELLEMFKNSSRFKTIENSAEIILGILEENNTRNNNIHNIFEQNSEEYWNTFNILTRISILAGFALLLEQPEILKL
ncbi:hypothetical protein [Spiroplasma monobiae]|uniref:Uncharacterized protein n=1 Tax=Spiroplasma monobiae MQ-1 TaxID=1336748 RepID=A0A2K9LU86_SPISQ|nr:hypothetical protein [Spiroplasma monobiae]AUM62618.1 hypothetical protein SMONO_v1c03690 [Spiroplasma monobiae MQ-1]